jgi:hypothetical protein
MDWILNTSYKEENDISKIGLKDFIFDTRSDGTNIKKGDSYILLDNEYSGNNKKSNSKVKNDEFSTFAFKEIGNILSVSKPITLDFTAAEAKENERRKKLGLRLLHKRKQYDLKLNKTKTLSKNNKVNDLAFSLTSVYNYKKPISHFQQQITVVNNDDFETIEKEMIYLSRTIFGKLINVLPFENKYEFAVMIGREKNNFNFKGIDFNLALDKLIIYIDERFLSRGELITNSMQLLKKINQNVEFNVNEVGFYNESLSSGNIIAIQAEYFEELFKSFDIKKLKQKMVDKDINRFNELFKNREWPLYLN